MHDNQALAQASKMRAAKFGLKQKMP